MNARPDTFIYRADKFIRRHWIGAISATVVVVSILAALGVSVWQTVIAQRERSKAQVRFNQVRKLAKTVLFDYHDNVAKLPGSTALREQMVKDSLSYLSVLSAESGNDADLQIEIAAAYDKVGDVQGNPYVANLGDVNGALNSYRKSLAIREELLIASPANLEVRRGLIKSHENIGDIHWTIGDHKLALDSYQKGNDLFLALEAKGLANDTDRFNHAKIEHRIGATFLVTGNSIRALEGFTKSLMIYESLQQSKVFEHRLIQSRIAIAKFKIGDAFYDQDSYGSALANYMAAASAFEDELAETQRKDVKVKRMFALSMSRVADALSKLKRLDEAQREIGKAIEIQQDISKADPQNVQILGELSSCFGLQAYIFGEMNLKERAIETFRKSIEIGSELIKNNSKWEDVKGDLSVTHLNHGELLLKAGRTDDAVQNFKRVRELLDTEALRSEQKKVLARANEHIEKLSGN